jgi:hypothetical protein
MFDLMIGIDGVRRRTRRSFDGDALPAPNRRLGSVRLTAAAALRSLAERIEPIGARRPAEVAGGYER